MLYVFFDIISFKFPIMGRKKFSKDLNYKQNRDLPILPFASSVAERDLFIIYLLNCLVYFIFYDFKLK